MGANLLWGETGIIPPYNYLMFLLLGRLVIEDFETLNKDQPRPANDVFIPFLR